MATKQSRRTANSGVKRGSWPTEIEHRLVRFAFLLLVYNRVIVDHRGSGIDAAASMDKWTFVSVLEARS